MSRRTWGRYSIQNALIMELRRAAAEAERQRALAEKQRRQDEQRQRLQERKNEVINKLVLIEELKKRLVTDDLLVYMDTQQLDNNIDNIRSRINSTDRLTDLTTIKSEIGKLERKIKKERNDAEDKKKQQDFKEEQDRINNEEHARRIACIIEKIKALNNEVYSYQREDYARIATGQIQDILFSIKDAEHLISYGDVEQLEERIKNIKNSFNHIKRDVEDKLIRWDVEVTSAEELINQAEIEIKILKEDEISCGWCSKEIGEFENNLKMNSDELLNVSEIYDLKKLDTVKENLKVILGGCVSVRNIAAKKEAHEKERAYVVNGIMGVLSEMGFNISNGPNLIESNNPESTVVVEAGLTSGKNVEVKVNSNGAIYADFNGYTGDECVGDLSNFREKLLNKYSVSYEIRGAEGTNPNKIKKGARGVPGGGIYKNMKS